MLIANAPGHTMDIIAGTSRMCLPSFLNMVVDGEHAKVISKWIWSA